MDLSAGLVQGLASFAGLDSTVAVNPLTGFGTSSENVADYKLELPRLLRSNVARAPPSVLSIRTCIVCHTHHTLMRKSRTSARQ
ncbi:hypothetical protein BDN67DRAFT_964570 [Paxillus ammoniavirescens]|nr:hypothetical protein BDN67DRAFT_964570 [Paxillus ammoniavirescens]